MRYVVLIILMVSQCFGALAGHWRLSEQSGVTIVDSAASNDGTWVGTDVVVNGTFDADTDWSGSGGDWVIAAGVATHASGNTTKLEQPSAFEGGKTYTLTFTVSGRTAGTVTGRPSNSTGTARSGNTTYSEVFSTNSNQTTLTFEPTSTFDGAIDDVILRPHVDSTPSPSGSGLVFDGAENYVDIGNAALNAKTVTIWVNQDDVAGNEYPVDLNGTDYLSIESGVLTVNGFTAPILYLDGVLATSGVTTITADKWYHIAITDSTAAVTSDMDIGRLNASYFAGDLSDVRVYDTVLTSAEISGILSSRNRRSRRRPR
jgi:hypothetical protein